MITARAKGVSERQGLYGHVFRNAMLIVIAGFPATLVDMLFTGSVLIEVIFSLDGLGLPRFEAVINRDYPVMFGDLYIQRLYDKIFCCIAQIEGIHLRWDTFEEVGYALRTLCVVRYAMRTPQLQLHCTN